MGYDLFQAQKETKVITDTQRLEFLVESDGYYVVRSKPDKSEYVVWDQSDGLTLAGKGSTMREAIDEAINKVCKK